MNPDAVRDAVALVTRYRMLVNRGWTDYDEFGIERAAILGNADLRAVCDALALMCISYIGLGPAGDEFLTWVLGKLGEVPS